MQSQINVLRFDTDAVSNAEDFRDAVDALKQAQVTAIHL
jgi:hypothetical protein